MSYLDRYQSDRERVHGERTDRGPYFGDWCEHCYDNGDPRPVRFPDSIDHQGLARYRCERCGSRWTCWWSIPPRAEGT